MATERDHDSPGPRRQELLSRPSTLAAALVFAQAEGAAPNEPRERGGRTGTPPVQDGWGAGRYDFPPIT